MWMWQLFRALSNYGSFFLQATDTNVLAAEKVNLRLPWLELLQARSDEALTMGSKAALELFKEQDELRVVAKVLKISWKKPTRGLWAGR
jgi:hypothetical protein